MLQSSVLSVNLSVMCICDVMVGSPDPGQLGVQKCGVTRVCECVLGQV